MNKHDIFALLNIPNDFSINIDDIIDDPYSFTRYVYLSRPAVPTFCPECGCIMHSKGIKVRTVNHPIYQDNTRLILKVSQRRWKCTGCSLSYNEEYPFLERYKRNSNLTPLLVLEAMKDLNRTAVSIAEQFNISDSEVHDLFSQYVDLKRLPLPECISIDEVYFNISANELYGFVIMDFSTGEIVDIVHNRWTNTLEDYFKRIPREERNNVKYVISDAYSPYKILIKRFFPSAEHILDSFHVVKLINSKISLYINEVLKKYRQKQKKQLEEKNMLTNRDYETIKDSEEIILLRDYRWVLLKDVGNINYSLKRYYHKKLGMYLDTYQIEQMFFAIDDKFKRIRDLKEMYIRFNSASYEDSNMIGKQLDEIIATYKKCELDMFIEFAATLEEFRDYIIASFKTVKRINKGQRKGHYEVITRLSNGPMEGFNRKPKDYKRNSRGFSNFDYTRNRILWSNIINPPVLAVPKKLKEIHIYHRKKKNKD